MRVAGHDMSGLRKDGHLKMRRQLEERLGGFVVDKFAPAGANQMNGN